MLDTDAPDGWTADWPTVEFPAGDDSDWGTNDGFAANAAGQNFWQYDKNVAWGVCALLDRDGNGLNEAATVTLHNAYPSYFNEVALYMDVGADSMPIVIDHWIISGGGQSWIVVDNSTLIRIDFNGDGADDFEILWNEERGAQIEPDDITSTENSFWMHVLQPCPQNALDELTFTIEFVGVQFNKFPLDVTPGPVTPPTTNGTQTPG